MDSKAIKPETFGKFDAVCAMGSPEHLCSVGEYREGKQDEIYRTYFKQVSVCAPGGWPFLLPNHGVRSQHGEVRGHQVQPDQRVEEPQNLQRRRTDGCSCAMCSPVRTDFALAAKA